MHQFANWSCSLTDGIVALVMAKSQNNKGEIKMILKELLEKKKSILEMVQDFIDQFGDADDEFIYEQLEELEEINESIAYYMAMA